MSDPVATLVPLHADIAAQRLTEVSIIESEWNGMSYKDRAAWWMSAKWYGCMSTEAYRRGDPLNTEISCRFGEPGFFIGTRIPYYEAQTEVITITAAASSASAVTTASEPVTTPTVDAPAPSENIVTPPIETSSVPEPINKIQECVPSPDEPAPAPAAAVSSNANSHKKKKKKHNKPLNPGEGKTIEIRVGGQSK